MVWNQERICTWNYGFNHYCDVFFSNIRTIYRFSSNGRRRGHGSLQHLHWLKPDMYERYHEPNGAIWSCGSSWRTNEMQVGPQKLYILARFSYNVQNLSLNFLSHYTLIYFFRSNCEDQINSLFVTTSNYPNRKTLFYREEFCIVAIR